MTAIISILDARLGKDPVIKSVGTTELCEFSVATDEGFGDKKITTWLECKVWGARAKTAAEYLKKGDKIALSGRYSCRTYDKKDGTQGYSNEVNVTEFTLPARKNEAKQEAAAEGETW